MMTKLSCVILRVLVRRLPRRKSNRDETPMLACSCDFIARSQTLDEVTRKTGELQVRDNAVCTAFPPLCFSTGSVENPLENSVVTAATVRVTNEFNRLHHDGCRRFPQRCFATLGVLTMMCNTVFALRKTDD
jgi:hypothetical protein